jgi:peroxiredoxin
MKTNAFFLYIILGLFSLELKAQKVENFNLQDALTGNYFQLDDHTEAKGIVLVFSSVTCPFSKLYEDRLVELEKKFRADDFVFALVNPHSESDPEESKEEMQRRAKEKSIAFPFLMDKEQIITQRLNISKLPEVVVITSHPTGFMISYRGAIDNNPQVASGASIKYLENALSSLSQRKNPSPSSTRAVGCNIKRL